MRTPGAGGRFQLARSVLFLMMVMVCAGRLAAQSPGFQILQGFSGPPNGSRPAAQVTQGSDGNYYGTTQSAGNANAGTVFKITPAGVLTTLYSFTGGADGSGPAARLIQGSDGNFYGTTPSGGQFSGQITTNALGKGPRPAILAIIHGHGTVFKITPAGVLTTLYTFTGGADGSNPGGGLAQDSEGNFYGTTEASGTGYGTVFQLTPAGVLTTLHTFAGADDGGYPLCDLILGGDGSFYGTTAGYGGSNSNGTIFKITTAGALTTLHNFSGGAGGNAPEAGLTLGSDGNFYGTTSAGGDSGGDGTVFQMTSSGTFTTLCTFPGGAGGSSPAGVLTQSGNDTFYGTTYFGGDSNGDGIVFQVSLQITPAEVTAVRPAGLPTAWVLTTVHTFSGTDGGNSSAGLTLGSDGNFYGTTVAGGGSNSEGTVFKITQAGILTSLYSFDSVGNGAFPVGALVQGSDGNFYGTTAQGGNVFGNGNVFRITPAGVLTGLYAFPGGAGGRDPEAGLTLGSDGNFYGATFSGGNGNGDGTIFEITPAGDLTTLYTFTGGTDGANPQGGLTLGNDRNFYGTTYSGSLL